MQNQKSKSITSVIAGVIFALIFVFSTVSFVRLVGDYNRFGIHMSVWTVIQRIIFIMAYLVLSVMLFLRSNSKLKHITDITITAAFGVLSILAFIGIILAFIGIIKDITFNELTYARSRYFFAYMFMFGLGRIASFLYLLAMLFMAAVAFMSFRNISNIIRKLWFLPAILIIISSLLGSISSNVWRSIDLSGIEEYFQHIAFNFILIDTVDAIFRSIGFACAGYSLSGDDAPKLGR